MTVITESRIISVVRAAEAVLSHRAGTSVRLAEPEDLGGSGRTVVVRTRDYDTALVNALRGGTQAQKAEKRERDTKAMWGE